MDDYNQKKETNYPKLDATLPAANTAHSNPIVGDPTEKAVDYYNASGAILVPPPPPTWNTKRVHPYHRYLSVLCTFLIGCIVGATIFLFIWQTLPQNLAHQNTTLVQSQTIHPTSTALNQSKNTDLFSTPTITTLEPNNEYTAMDIVKHMQERDKNMSIESTNTTIWDWSHDNYYISVHATSSIQWIGCPFESVKQCADTWHFGLWVYSDGNEARSVWQQVTSDSLSCNDTSPASSGMHVSCGQAEAEYLHGRCLLLGDNGQSTYGQIVTQYCL